MNLRVRNRLGVLRFAVASVCCLPFAVPAQSYIVNPLPGGSYLIQKDPYAGFGGSDVSGTVAAIQQIKNIQQQQDLIRQQSSQQIESSRASADAVAKNQKEYKEWLAVNTWYGKDKPRTEYANLYAQQLRQQNPNLVGRAFYDNVTQGVIGVFGPYIPK